MASVTEVRIPIMEHQGRGVGDLVISLLPRSRVDSVPPPLVDLRGVEGRDPDLAPVQLLEGEEYRYRFEIREGNFAPISSDRGELFEPDTGRGDAGRLRPGIHTGYLPVTVFVGGTEFGRFELEVRSRKLEYLHHYRWMLNDLTEDLAEVVMEQFAPTEQRFSTRDGADASTLYQRFAFLKSLLEREVLSAAVLHIFTRPHRAWVDTSEFRPPGAGVRASSSVTRQIARPGPREAYSTLPQGLGSLPARFYVPRTEITLDTPENRFVKFALTRWRDALLELGQAMANRGNGREVERGVREVEAVLVRLDEVLSADLFREVGRLTQFPSSSPVLQKA